MYDSRIINIFVTFSAVGFRVLGHAVDGIKFASNLLEKKDQVFTVFVA